MRYLRHPIKRLAKVAALSRVLLVGRDQVREQARERSYPGLSREGSIGRMAIGRRVRMEPFSTNPIRYKRISSTCLARAQTPRGERERPLRADRPSQVARHAQVSKPPK